jgi:hypothetical protein
VRWLEEQGLEARAIATRFEGERDEPEAPGEADMPGGAEPFGKVSAP